MIDTNELRRLAQAALAGPDGISLNWIKFLQDFQHKASPAAISELLDRLESAERECDNANAAAAGVALQAEALQAELSEAHNTVTRQLSVLADENTALRAKIAEMEKQEPVAEWINGAFTHYPHLKWKRPYKAIVGAKLYTNIYALPGAKGEEE